MNYEESYLAYKENPTEANWEALGEQLYPYLKAIIASNYGRNYFFLEDCVGEITLKILGALRDPNNGIENIATWTYTIARNTCLDRLRIKSSHKESVIGEGAESKWIPPYERKILLEQLMEQLNPIETEITLLRADGFSAAGIAEKLDITEVTVWKRWQRVKEKLRTPRVDYGDNN